VSETHKPGILSGPGIHDRQRAGAGELVDLNEIAEIELFIVKRMKEYTVGDHASVFKGGGFNFVGLRDWQPGDRMSSIDWAQSSMTNFSPMITKEFEQDSNAVIVAVADASMSTRCGAHGATIAAAIARAVAAAGLSAVFFQDMFGLITFDDRFQQVQAVRPRVGRTHILHALDVYGQSVGIGAPASAPVARSPEPAGSRDIISAIEGQLRRASLVPVISDFLFPDVERIIRELALLNAVHDVMLLMADVRFAYELPRVSDGWIEAYDVESGRPRVFSRREMRKLATRVGEWQDGIARLGREAGLDVVRVGLDRWEMETTLVAFAAERRLRKIA
jgi:uncharacterized protein (DUF58 family)